MRSKFQIILCNYLLVIQILNITLNLITLQVHFEGKFNFLTRDSHFQHILCKFEEYIKTLSQDHQTAIGEKRRKRRKEKGMMPLV